MSPFVFRQRVADRALRVNEKKTRYPWYETVPKDLIANIIYLTPTRVFPHQLYEILPLTQIYQTESVIASDLSFTGYKNQCQKHLCSVFIKSIDPPHQQKI